MQSTNDRCLQILAGYLSVNSSIECTKHLIHIQLKFYKEVKRIFFYRCHQVVLWLLQIKLYKSNASSYVIVRMYPSFKSSWNIICSLTSYYLRCGSLHALQRFSSKGGLAEKHFKMGFKWPLWSTCHECVIDAECVSPPSQPPHLLVYLWGGIFTARCNSFFLPAFFKELLSFR